MANTYTQIYLQFVFAVQNRQSLIQETWKDELYKYITGIIREHDHKVLIINGIPDHIHIFIGYNENQMIPKLLQDIKGGSSHWINTSGYLREKFSWQSGYGAFSYSASQKDQVIKYIQNQEEHHLKKTFREEYIALLQKFQIPYDERYVLKDIF